MNRNIMTRRYAAVMAVMLITLCIGQSEVESISVTGSTTVLPIIQKAAEQYMDAHPSADIQVSGGGSGVGVQAVGEGTADIGMSSRDLKESEKSKYPDVNLITIALDGIAVIVHPSNPIKALTLEDVKGIYKGTYTNWSQLGGDNAEIVVIGRDSASGTREFFWVNVMQKEDFVPTMLEKNSNGAVKQTVSQTPGAVGYVGLGYLDETVKTLKIKVGDREIEPSVENVKSGVYPISRTLYLITRGEPQGVVKEFIDFILSSEGQKIVEEEGFVSIL